jgi:DNA-binding NtrC family response regulator
MENTVLSLSPNQDALAMREATLRNGGLKVISVLSPIQARFEIEMGRCGVFVICYRVSKEQAEELTKLFRRNCPEGRVIFVTAPGQKAEVPRGTDLAVPESTGGELVLQAVKDAPNKAQGSKNAA